MNYPAGTRATCLQTGAPMEDDHDVFSKVFGLLCLTFAQTFPGRNHQDDGHDTPSDTKHCQESPEFVRPQSPEDIANQIAQNHGLGLDASMGGR